ncbi:MAG: hypothetical protein RLZZ367_2526 [Bacteroidota bacterium]|jgi:hypothetical protein
MEKNVLAECYGDTLLVKQLKFNYIEYHSGIGEVARQMQRYFDNRKAIAIIDNDKHSVPSYFTKECNPLKNENGIVVMKHKKQEHYVIKISPAFEEFINDCAVSCGMELFEKDKKKFKEITKDSKLHQNQKFINYLNKLIAQNPNGIKTLRNIVDDINKIVKKGPAPTAKKKKK